MQRMSELIVGSEGPSVSRDLGLAVLRVGTGVIFIVHGWADATQPGGAGANVENYRGAGIPLPEVSAWLGAYMQLIGGAALLLGAATRPVGAGLAVVMSGALIFVHRTEQLAIGPDGSGYGFALAMFTASIALAATGAGRFSVDRFLTTPRRDEPARQVGDGHHAGRA